MVLLIPDILSFGYYAIFIISELIGYRKRKKPSALGRRGVSYEADRSMHPE